jgi:general stress protein YciG
MLARSHARDTFSPIKIFGLHFHGTSPAQAAVNGVSCHVGRIAGQRNFIHEVIMPDRDQSHTANRGFASMDEQRQREIAREGGHASGGNFKNDPPRAAEAGRKGGQSVPAEERSFSRDPALASEAGRKGGEHSHGSQHGGQTSSGHQGGGNFAEDRERAAGAGRRGGEHSHGHR